MLPVFYSGNHSMLQLKSAFSRNIVFIHREIVLFRPANCSGLESDGPAA